MGTFHKGIYFFTSFFVGARLDLIRNVGFVMVILDQCGKSPQQKLLRFSQNAYFANTK